MTNVTVENTYDVDNRLSKKSSVTYEYDKVGNKT